MACRLLSLDVAQPLMSVSQESLLLVVKTCFKGKRNHDSGLQLGCVGAHEHCCKCRFRRYVIWSAGEQGASKQQLLQLS